MSVLVKSLHAGRPPGVKCEAEPTAAVSQLQNLGNGLFLAANPRGAHKRSISPSTHSDSFLQKFAFGKFYRKERALVGWKKRGPLMQPH